MAVAIRDPFVVLCIMTAPITIQSMCQAPDSWKLTSTHVFVHKCIHVLDVYAGVCQFPKWEGSLQKDPHYNLHLKKGTPIIAI